MNMERYINSKPDNFKPQEQEMEVFRDKHEEAVMLEALGKAQKILEAKSLKPEQFTDTYSEKLLTKCADYVANCEARFKEKDESKSFAMRIEVYGKTLEGLIYDQINNNKVFGDNVRSVITAKYDDYYAGIDSVIEGQNEDGSSYIGCALDATFGSPEKKILGIRDNIKSGVLNDVIFYESPFGDPPQIHGRLQGIPKIVIGMDSKHLTQLAELWIQNDHEGLAKNQLFLMLLRQIEQQAEVYEIVAKRTHKLEIAKRYEQIHTAISKLYKEQKTEQGIIMLESNIINDSVNQAIVQQLHSLLDLK